MFTCTIEIFGHLISPLCVLCASVFLKFKTQRHREHGELVTEKVNKAEVYSKSISKPSYAKRI
jgi:hypothetical protein